MKQDKKNYDGKIRMVLLEKFGKPKIDCEVDEVLIREALHFHLNE
jgi:3-dehydroquinate synthase